eukprot:TRINITY_DN14344_c0_g1_i1.p1 TRINITY_DN14344_c0_g1~~TRINITY_DN14344_c0_g1_i1.p1  ORF type:complete len:361 (+),score=98.58 TRINITY_DN14344_c0_g1_i1:76-1083(+)
MEGNGPPAKRRRVVKRIVRRKVVPAPAAAAAAPGAAGGGAAGGEEAAAAAAPAAAEEGDDDPPALRLDYDGVAKTRSEFFDLYGGYEEWEESTPAPAAAPAAGSPRAQPPAAGDQGGVVLSDPEADPAEYCGEDSEGFGVFDKGESGAGDGPADPAGAPAAAAPEQDPQPGATDACPPVYLMRVDHTDAPPPEGVQDDSDSEAFAVFEDTTAVGPPKVKFTCFVDFVCPPGTAPAEQDRLMDAACRASSGSDTRSCRWEEYTAGHVKGLPPRNTSGLPVVFAGVGSLAFVGSGHKSAVSVDAALNGHSNHSRDGGLAGPDGQPRLACLCVAPVRP